MAKPEWGTKRICPNCGARYYDLRKAPPTCPTCGTVFDPEALLKSRRARPAPVEEVKKLPVEVEDEEAAETEEAGVEEVEDDVGVDDLEEEAEEVVQDEDDVLLEDASELGEDEDMGEVVDMEGEDEER